MRYLLTDLFRCCDSIDIRHIDIHNHNIWLEFHSHINGFAAAFRSSDNLDGLLKSEHPSNVISGFLYVVYN